MSSRCLRLAAAALLAGLAGVAEARTLRVCADPNNMPFSNAAGEGFENHIAAIVAEELGASVDYTWWAQRRGYVRNTLAAGACDVVPGVAAGVERIATTPPYYRSTYVFVARAGTPLPASLDDPALARLRIGVQLIGDNGANTPPAQLLADRGITANVRGYHVAGDYGTPSPPARIIDAVAAGEIDVAIAWGPMAGWFARRAAVPLATAPVPQPRGTRLPVAFDIAMGVRRGDNALREEVAGALARRKADIDAILAAYGVPRLDLPALAARP